MCLLPTAPTTPHASPSDAIDLDTPASPVPTTYAPGARPGRPDLATSPAVATTTCVPGTPICDVGDTTRDPSGIVDSSTNADDDAETTTSPPPPPPRQHPTNSGATAKYSTSACMTPGARAAPAPKADRAMPVASLQQRDEYA
jgi:hypothetical protein